MQNHDPKVTQSTDRTWVVECVQCRNDPASTVPIGIGMPLRDRETAERLRDNHAGRRVRAAASWAMAGADGGPAGGAGGAPGTVTKTSPRPVADTVARLLDLLGSKGIKVFAVIDQQAEARAAGLELRETTLVIFGNPRRGRASWWTRPWRPWTSR